ncbi:hypothetical protein Psta_3417 [Pirellula staleyi DSM 6068]|uniref:Uncharacterized protein n=1 Tax=Pirellula staleyi (strain ATCC 27377 / DSM 6068 / ICPB 4128) TaxID=530564 RepID=D2QY04_PIRSD|nr:hypothetical protein Psta_3417 [Pirellula staleyi DSM 6068]
MARLATSERELYKCSQSSRVVMDTLHHQLFMTQLMRLFRLGFGL